MEMVNILMENTNNMILIIAVVLLFVIVATIYEIKLVRDSGKM